MFAENNNEPANNVFRKIYFTKRKNSRKFLLCIAFSGSLKCSDWVFKLHRIAENFYSI